MANIQARLRRGKQRIERRLAGSREDRGGPMLSGAGIRVELANKIRAIGTGGIGLVHQLARQTGLVEAIDRRVQVLKVHRPYHESDHVLNLAYNALCEGTRLEDIELRRNDEVFLDALGTERIPDHGRRLLSAVFRGGHPPFDGGDRRGAAKRLGPAAAGVLPASHDRPGRHAGDHHGPVQAGNGHLLQGHLGLSSAGRFACRDGRSAAGGQP